MTPDTQAPDDRRLVADFLRTRSEADFLRLYDRHADGLFRFAARLMGGPGPDAEELVQEAWIRALRGLSAFRFESSLRTWLCSIVFNRWREVRRRDAAGRRLKVIEGARSSGGEAPVVMPGLERALLKLPQKYRVVLLLHDVEGFTHEEIGLRFGVAVGTSKSLLHRARRQLRRVLESRGVIER
jgi:RNA polymerase sigma factor (sigma-70 family)